MKAAVYYDIGDIRYEELEKPEIGFGEVLVKMKSCGLCGTDVHKVLHKTVKPPVVLGHEVAGEIVEVGKDVKKFNIGDRVFFAHHVPCFTCEYCRKGHYTLCSHFRETNIYPGGFSEYIRVPIDNVKHTMHKIPENMSFQETSMVEPLACCLYGVNKLNVRYGDSVLIMGAGQVGILFCQLMKFLGASKVIVSDISTYKLSKAKEAGSDEVIDVSQEDLIEGIKKITKGKGIDTAIIATSISSLLKDSVKCIARGGQILVFSPFDINSTVAINSKRFFNDEISIFGSYSSSPFDYDIAIKLISEKRIDVNKMITHKIKLNELQKAIDITTDTKQNSLKIIIEP
ncbi:zinc-dependent dehydrogenase [Maledivibacter halophilus]|uniref:L-iditol 2-dehydrogenase n=1 Tax=Maledivibacter halophilus TaxID=36842 RepID=A0A1T5MJ22_9FIRM|nr:zinc-dependent dehydrogenase [Maledivibacter halophilus]SKC87914.1 L-iditol 2-dehydrogenase [Maledivibacter halophilus]